MIAEANAADAALETHRARADQAERQRDGWRETVERVAELARAMRTWCSPHGVATDYANRIAEAIVGAERPLEPGTAFTVLDALERADPVAGWRARAEAAEQEVARLQGVIDRHDHGIMPVCEGYMAAKAQQAEETIARVRADCEEQTSKPITDDMERGIWAQARRTLNTLDAIAKEQA